MELQQILELITAIGGGASIPPIIGYFRDRKKNVSDVNRADTETTLLKLDAVIEQLTKENARLVGENTRLQDELEEEQGRNATQRKRIRELEAEVDSVRQLARDTQHRCDHLAHRLKELLDGAQEENN